MKPPRHHKILGISLGEQSLLAAEVTQGEKLEVKRLAEFVYPAGVSFAQPAALGAAFAEFLRSKQFTAKSAVVGIPAKWLAVKSKDVPPADASTLATILRLQAEGDFSAELKALVYDYAGLTTSGESSSVMLIATPKKYVDAAVEFCVAAKLSAVAVTPSVVALSSATSRAIGKDAMVLAVASDGTEFAAQDGESTIAVRTLRSATTGEVRRAVSGVPASAGMAVIGSASSDVGSQRELVLWDGVGVDSEWLGRGLGVTIRAADLAALGVDASLAAANGAMTAGVSNGSIATGSPGQGASVYVGHRKFAAAVAVAIESLGDRTATIDFLHSRLAAPKKPLLPRWAVYTGAAVVALIVCVVLAYSNLESQQQQFASDKAKIEKMKGEIAAADAFVSKVTFAQAWHTGAARYLACVRDLTKALPDDMVTYATNVQVHEITQLVKGKSVQTGNLFGTLYGKTADQQRVQTVLDGIKGLPSFTDVKLGGTQDAGRGREVSFSITFTYRPAKG